MKNNEIIIDKKEAGDRLIAEFMGKKNIFRYETKERGFLGLYIAEDERGYIDYTGNGIMWIDYHYSWNSLHEVMEKCWRLTTEEDREFCGLRLFELGLFSDIESVWTAVVEFIGWYNNQKK